MVHRLNVLLNIDMLNTSSVGKLENKIYDGDVIQSVIKQIQSAIENWKEENNGFKNSLDALNLLLPLSYTERKNIEQLFIEVITNSASKFVQAKVIEDIEDVWEYTIRLLTSQLSYIENNSETSSRTFENIQYIREQYSKEKSFPKNSATALFLKHDHSFFCIGLNYLIKKSELSYDDYALDEKITQYRKCTESQKPEKALEIMLTLESYFEKFLQPENIKALIECAACCDFEERTLTEENQQLGYELCYCLQTNCSIDLSSLLSCLGTTFGSINMQPLLNHESVSAPMEQPPLLNHESISKLMEPSQRTKIAATEVSSFSGNACSIL